MYIVNVLYASILLITLSLGILPGVLAWRKKTPRMAAITVLSAVCSLIPLLPVLAVLLGAQTDFGLMPGVFVFLVGSFASLIWALCEPNYHSTKTKQIEPPPPPSYLDSL
jgi:hypothetical protein